MTPPNVPVVYSILEITISVPKLVRVSCPFHLPPLTVPTYKAH